MNFKEISSVYTREKIRISKIIIFDFGWMLTFAANTQILAHPSIHLCKALQSASTLKVGNILRKLCVAANFQRIS